MLFNGVWNLFFIILLLAFMIPLYKKKGQKWMIWLDYLLTFICLVFDFIWLDLILLDIYPAREKSIGGVDSKTLAAEIPNCVYCDMQSAVREALSYHTGAIALMGAGEVEVIKKEFIRLGENTGYHPQRR